MFTKFRIQNFRTHVDTEVSLKDLTLIIGANNSGKTNLLEALSFFSEIVRRGAPDSKNEKVHRTDYSENKHILSNHEPIVFTSEWLLGERKITYILTIPSNLLVTENLVYEFQGKKNVFNSDAEKHFRKLSLWKEIENELRIASEEVFLDALFEISHFFPRLSQISYYHFQPNILKRRVKIEYILEKNFLEEFKQNKETHPALGSEGSHFELFIRYIKQQENETYNKFIGFLRRFESSFVGINIDEDNIYWSFDMGNSNFPSFPSSKISDGLIKAAAVALLCAMESPPSIIMLEEIENGINQKNLAEFLQWLVNTSDNGAKTQFIVTSHSPSVIREFADKIDCIYNVHLKKKKGYVSEVTNLNDALKPLVRFGAIKEEFVQEIDGVIHLKPYALTELFYNGILGEL
jgi:AAA15 family ATPase/GTPase